MILVKDDIFQDPDKIRQKSLSSHYKEPCFERDWWRGYRCNIKNFSNLEEFDNISNAVSDFYRLKNFSMDFSFHYSLENTKNTCFPSFDEYKYHTDHIYCKYAGVVYLQKNIPKKSGTIIINHLTDEVVEVENIYNRLVCYPSNFTHAPVDLFGKNIDDGRMTITFFIYE